MAANDYRLCGHPSCRCTVPAGTDYCSKYCEQRSHEKEQGKPKEQGPTRQSRPGCGCGHAACLSA